MKKFRILYFIGVLLLAAAFLTASFPSENRTYAAEAEDPAEETESAEDETESTEDEEVIRSREEEESRRKAEESSSIEASIESEKQSIEESIRASEEESIRQSIEESSRQESISEEESRIASIAASEAAEEASKVHLGDYTIFGHLNGVTAPEGFVLAVDNDTFDKSVEAFYSTSFKEYVYYAEKGDKGSYYVYNPMRNSLIPYVTFKGTDGVTFLVSAPASVSDLPDDVKRETDVNLGGISDSASTFVPAYVLENSKGEEISLLYLVSDNGDRDYYEFGMNHDRITLKPWTPEEETTETETTAEEETTESTTEESTETEAVTESETEPSTEESKEESPAGRILKNYLIWLIAVGIIIILLIIAIIVVAHMSRRQEKEEEKIDRLARKREDEAFLRNFDSSYSNRTGREVEPFDTDFEDAFPEEMQLGGKGEGMNAAPSGNTKPFHPEEIAAALSAETLGKVQAEDGPSETAEAVEEAVSEAPEEAVPEVPEEAVSEAAEETEVLSETEALQEAETQPELEVPNESEVQPEIEVLNDGEMQPETKAPEDSEVQPENEEPLTETAGSTSPEEADAEAVISEESIPEEAIKTENAEETVKAAEGTGSAPAEESAAAGSEVLTEIPQDNVQPAPEAVRPGQIAEPKRRMKYKRVITEQDFEILEIEPRKK